MSHPPAAWSERATYEPASYGMCLRVGEERKTRQPSELGWGLDRLRVVDGREAATRDGPSSHRPMKGRHRLVGWRREEEDGKAKIGGRRLDPGIKKILQIQLTFQISQRQRGRVDSRRAQRLFPIGRAQGLPDNRALGRLDGRRGGEGRAAGGRRFAGGLFSYYIFCSSFFLFFFPPD